VQGGESAARGSRERLRRVRVGAGLGGDVLRVTYGS
jgi:hypothetical protein